MKRLTQCPSCGAPITDVKPDDINYICKYCGVSHKLDVTHIDEKINKIYSLLANLRFDEAYSHADELVMSNPKSGYAYFLRVLAANRVCYCDNDNPDWNYKKIPTLNDVQFGSITKLDDVKKAIEYAETDYDREYFKKTFAYLEKVRKSAVDVIEGHKYDCDIFISVKVTQLDENGKPLLDANGNALTTYDFAEASKLYGRLKDRYPECKIFLSENVKNEFVGLNYEPIIFAALRSAKVMILRGDSNQNINSVWVRNEWKRYLRWMRDLDDGTKRNFVFLQGNNSVTIPSDFKDLQAIKVYEMGAEQQLYTFLDNCLSEQHGKKIVGKTFDQQVAQIDGAQVTAVERKALRTYSGAQNKAVDSLIESAMYDLRYTASIREAEDRKRSRKHCFDELRDILKAHPDAHKAELYLLLEEGNATELEDIFFTGYSPSVLKRFFEIADEKEALQAIDKVVNWFANSKNKNIKQVTPLFNTVIAPHFDYINKEKLTRLLAGMRNECKQLITDTSTAAESSDIVDYIECHLQLGQYLTNNDPNCYIRDRVFWLKNLTGTKIDDNLRIKILKLCNEIKAVQKGNVYALWFSISASIQEHLCLPEDIDWYYENTLEDYENGDVDELYEFIHDRTNIDRFKELFSYAPNSSGDKFDKKTFLQAFLELIIASENTYDKAPDGSLEPSQGTSDEALNGFDLFNKYIEYDLSDDKLPTEPYRVPLDKNGYSVALEIDKKLARFKKGNHTVIDDLLLSFATKLQDEELFEHAIKVYKMYLAQQNSQNSVDCILVRFYITMCENKCRDIYEQRASLTRVKVVSLKSDLFDLINSTNSAQEKSELQKLRKELSEFAEYHDNFVSAGSKIGYLLEELPPCTIANAEKYKEKIDELVKTCDNIRKTDSYASSLVDSNLGAKINRAVEQKNILCKVENSALKVFGKGTNYKRAWERMCNELNYKSGTTQVYPFAVYEEEVAILKQNIQYLTPKNEYESAIKYLQQHFDEAKKDCKSTVETGKKIQAENNRRKQIANRRRARREDFFAVLPKIGGYVAVIAPKILMAVFVGILWFVHGCDCSEPITFDMVGDFWIGAWICCIIVDIIVGIVLNHCQDDHEGLYKFHRIAIMVIHYLITLYFAWKIFGGVDDCLMACNIENLSFIFVSGALAGWNTFRLYMD